MYVPVLNMELSDPGIAAVGAGGIVLLLGRRWYWTSAAVPLVVLGLAWAFFGN